MATGKQHNQGNHYHHHHHHHHCCHRRRRLQMKCLATSCGSFIVQITLLFSNIMNTTSQQDLFYCDFDTWPCAIIQDPTGNFNWLRYSGKTPTDFTGPDGGQGGSQWYFYIESSDPRQPNDQARFTTFDLQFTGDVCVRFYYYAYGEGVGQLVVYTQRGSDFAADHVDRWRLRGDQGATWRYRTLDIRLNDTITRVGWNGIRGLSYLGDIGVDTIRIAQGRCAPDVTLPWSCDLETDDLCGMRQRTDDDFDWFRQSGSTPTPGTGPLAAESGSYYIYIETSNTIAPSTKAEIESPVILYTGDVCVTFWYSMYGSSIGNLSVYTLNTGAGRPWWSRNTPTAQNWTQEQVTVSLTNNTDRVGFQGTRGSDIFGDIAIDNIQIATGRCPFDTTTSTTTTTPTPTTASTVTTVTTSSTTSATTPTPTTITTTPTTITTTPTTIMTTPNFGNLPHVPLPWSCDFEVDECEMEQLNYVNYIWTRWSGPSSPTGQTGPQSAESGQYYMFLNTSAPRQQGDNALLETAYIVYSGSACVRFWLNMFGPNVGRLFLYTSQPGRFAPWGVWTVDMGPQWFLVEVTIQLVYDRVGLIAEVGNGPLGFIAVDNLSIVPMPCNYTGPVITTAATPSSSSSLSPPTTATTATTATTRTTSTTTSSTSTSFHYAYVTCDMEGEGSSASNCRLRQDSNDNFDWTGMAGETPSGQLSDRVIDGVKYPVTGPESAKQGRFYLFTEATGTTNGMTTRLIAEGSDFARRPVGCCLRFYFEMNGFHTGTLRVYSRLNQGPRVVQWELSGDKGPVWQSASVDFNMTDVTEIGIEAEMTGDFSGDIAIDALTMTEGKCQPAPSNTPWTCSFELSDGSVTLCGMTTPPGANFEWTLWSGKTPSEETGPSQAYSQPYFIYTEASEPRIQGDRAEVLVPRLFVTGTLCLSFYRNMNGFHMGTLQVYTVTNGDATTLWSLSGDHSDQWVRTDVTIAAQYDTQIGFRGIRGGGYSGDMALDSITVVNGPCNN